MAVGIIAEYNPFHAGHAYQISEVRRLTGDEEIVALMSGSFTQRGEPAILDKWTRACAAVSGGCDLVLELPFVSAVRSAQDFARGGIKIFSELGVIDSLAFGSEFDNLEKLQRVAKVFDEENFSDRLRGQMAKGISYAESVAKILADSAKIDEKILRQPNTILAVEYLRVMPKNFSPLLIPRTGGAYNETILRENFSSAAAIRSAIREKNPDLKKISSSISDEVLQTLLTEKSFGLIDEEFLLRPILAKVIASKATDLQKIFGVNEGLEFRIISAAKSAKTFEEFCGAIVGRRYPLSRIKRLLLHFLTDFTKEREKFFSENASDFARVLAFNSRGKNLLKKIRSSSTIPIISKVTKHLTERDIFECRRTLEPYRKKILFDVTAENLRGILFTRPRNFFADFSTSPIFM